MARLETSYRVGGHRVPDGPFVLAVEGDVDMAVADGFERALRSALVSASGVVVDLTATEFIDSYGVGALYRVHRIAHARGIPLTVVCPDESRARRVLAIAGFEGGLALASTREDAIAAMR